MQVVRFSTFEQLAPHAEAWDRLASGVPFRSFDWLSCWWRHYGSDARKQPRLLVLGVQDSGGRLVGLAPWYLHRSPAHGRVIRWLGSGEVCSDHVSVLAWPGSEDAVADALAEHLLDPAQLDGDALSWDLLALGNVDSQDRVVGRLVDCLSLGGLVVDCRPGPNCWRLELPTDWSDYLTTLSRSHRKQVRRIERRSLDAGRAELRTVERVEDLDRATSILVDLHGKRRRALRQCGCFDSTRFAAFHREVMPQLLRHGQLQLHWLELDGRPIAAEYHLFGNGIMYAYQAGIDPDALKQEPGRLITIATLRRAVRQGCRAMDFLRGDEPYKAHFRASPRATIEYRVVSDRLAARLRHRLWSAGKRIKRWAAGRPSNGPAVAAPPIGR